MFAISWLNIVSVLPYVVLALVVGVCIRRRNRPGLNRLEGKVSQVQGVFVPTLIAICILGIGLLVGDYLVDTGYEWVGTLVIGVTSAVMVLYFVAVRPRILGRFFQEARNVNWYKCPHCFYNLERVSGTSSCPECGKTYTAETLKEEWQQMKARG